MTRRGVEWVLDTFIKAAFIIFFFLLFSVIRISIL